MKFIKNLLVAAAVYFGLQAVSASAASLSLIPKGQSFGVGQEFTVDLVMDTENVKVNAAQAVIRFPQQILQFVSADRSQSVFGFWVEDPMEANGAISFLGGTSESISGKSLLIFTMRFKTVGSGSAAINITDGIVTADDGKGTNVLSKVQGTNITVLPTVVFTPPPSAPSVQEQPKRVVRPPEPARTLPTLPKLKVNLYPDPDPAKWYNQTGETIVLWEVPADITQVAAVIDRSPYTVPTAFDKELFNGKNFGVLKEGIWYVHVRFRNNIGSGPTAHYRIAVDMTPPADFRIESIEGLRVEGLTENLITDNPQPLLRFATTDALSGISHYLIQVDGLESLQVEKGELRLPLQPPGKRIVSIKAVDAAGNFREKILNLEILPIDSPRITFVNSNVYVAEGDLLVRGTANQEHIVKLTIRKDTSEIVAEDVATVDTNGNWAVVINQPLKKGKYFVEAVAQDSRGALSLPVKSEIFKVRKRPLFTVAGIGITETWFFIGLIIILLGGFAGGWFAYHLWRSQIKRRVIIAQRDVVSAFGMIKNDVDKMLAKYADKRLDELEASEIEFILKKVSENLEKMEKYVIENIKEISD